LRVSPLGGSVYKTLPPVIEEKGTPPRKLLFISEESGWPKVKVITPVLVPTGQYTTDVKTKITQCLHIAVELASLFGFNANGYSVDKSAVYLSLMTDKVVRPDPWIDVIKYKIACFFSYEMGLELPPDEFMFNERESSRGVLFHGRLRRWIRVIKKHEPQKYQSFITSVSIGLKSGLPRPSPARVQYSVKKTVKKLFIQRQKPKDPDHRTFKQYCRDGNINMFGECKAASLPGDRFGYQKGISSRAARCRPRVSHSTLIRQVIRTTNEIFRDQRFSSDQVTFNFPSTSANYVRGRNDGGSVCSVHDFLIEFMQEFESHMGFEFDKFKEFGICHGTERYWHEFSPTEYYWRTSPDHLKLRQGDGFTDWRRPPSGEFRSRMRLEVDDPTKLQKKFLEFYMFLVGKAMGEKPNVEPVGLMEALKVRIITKCPPILMYVMKPIQKWMAKCIGRYRVFSLTKGPVTERVVSESIRSDLKPGENWLSGDYAAATDNLRKEFSEAVGRAVGRFILPDEFLDEISVIRLRTLLCRSLTGFSLGLFEILDQIDDAKDDEHSAYHAQLNPSFHLKIGDVAIEEFLKSDMTFEQQDGQLMGSVTSFVILCIINAALCRYCLELGYQRKFELDDSDLNLLINGDDCVFVANDMVHAAWRWLGPRMGLEPSLGKYYYTNKFLQVNSRTFVPKLRPRFCMDVSSPKSYMQTFYKVKFVSMGLVLGMGRSCAVDKPEEAIQVEKLMNLSSWYNENMRQAPSYTHKSLHANYVCQLKTVIDHRSNRIPWYLPQWRGGLGLRPPKALKIGPSVGDLRRLTAAMNDGKEIPCLKTKDKWIYDQVVKDCVHPLALVLDDGIGSDQEFVNLLRFQTLTYSPLSKIMFGYKWLEEKRMRALQGDHRKMKFPQTYDLSWRVVRRLNSFWMRQHPRGSIKELNSLWDTTEKWRVNVIIKDADETVWDRALW